MEVYLAGNCEGIDDLSVVKIKQEGYNILLSYMHPAAERSMDKLILYLVSDRATFSIVPPWLLSKFHTLFSMLGVGGGECIDTMIKELYLAGGDKFGKEEMRNYMECYLADAEKGQFESDLKFNALFSYAFQQGVDYYHDNEMFRGKLFIDSGAFTAWTRGKEINVDEYIDWINKRSDFIDLYGQVDVISGNRESGDLPTMEEVRIAAEKTWENYLYMYPKMNKPEGLLYTFHVGEPIEFLARALEWKDDKGEHMKYIALGGMVGKSADVRYRFLEQCFDTIRKSSNPDVKVHAFGMTDFDLLEKFPITSADSTSWIMVGAMGNIMSDYGTISISEKQKFDKNHWSNLPPAAEENLTNMISKFGFTIQELAESRGKRIMYNAMYMIDKCSRIDNSKVTIHKKKKLF